MFMLGVGIALTIAKDTTPAFLASGTKAEFNGSTTLAYRAVTDTATIDRQANIERLRAALAKNETLVAPEPSVEESPVVSSAQQASSTMAHQNVSEDIDSCASDDNASIVRSWPLQGVALAEQHNMRVALWNPLLSTAPAEASGTENAAAQITLLALPLSPQALPTPHCVSGDTVGVTLAGALISNADATFYRGYGPNFLIGYARDGYPIYGVYDGAVDACGGYMANDGYRYAVSKNRNHLISCFTAFPAQFSGL